MLLNQHSGYALLVFFSPLAFSLYFLFLTFIFLAICA